MRSFSRLTLLCGLLVAFTHSATLAQLMPAGGELSLNSTTSLHQDTPVIEPRPDGSFVVAWESDGQDGDGEGIVMRLFDANGAPLTAEHVVNTETTDLQEDPSIAVFSTGAFVIVWDSMGQDGSERGIYGQRFTAAGSPDGTEFLVNVQTGGDQNDAVVAATSDNGFVVVWEQFLGFSLNEELLGRQFDSSGAPLTGEYPIHAPRASDQEDAAIGIDASDTVVVAWESDGQDGDLDGIFVRRFDPDGTPLTGEIQVNVETAGEQDDVTLAVGPGGEFVVVWEDDTQDLPDLEGVFARFFDDATAPTTGELQVDVFPTGAQKNADVVLNLAGHAIVTYQSDGQDGDGAGVILRRISSNGVGDTSEVIVNSTTTGPQGFPWLALGTSHTLLVAFESDDLGADFREIKAQLYLEATLFTDGFESGDVSAWSATTP